MTDSAAAAGKGVSQPSVSIAPTTSFALPLPAFDENGNLPIGDLFAMSEAHPVYYTTLRDTRQRLVDEFTDSRTRSPIWDGWMRHRENINALGLTYSTLINGSYCTTKLDPCDVDLCYLFDAAEINRLPAPERSRLKELFDVPACRENFTCDPYSVSVYPVQHFRFQSTVFWLSYWTRVFGVDRSGRSKSILMIGERGTL